jgi:hypothetical protein
MLVTEPPSSVSRVSYPPPEYVKVNGWLNRAGEPIFYGSLSQFQSCLLECDAEVGETFAVSSWRTTVQMKVNHLGYSQAALDQAGAHRPLPDFINPGGYRERNLIICDWQARVFTAHVPKGEGERYRLPIGLKKLAIGVGGPTDPNPYSGIQYPSIASKLLNDNIALLPWEVDRKVNLSQVILLTVDAPAVNPSAAPGLSSGLNLRQLDSARPDGNGKLIWGVE